MSREDVTMRDNGRDAPEKEFKAFVGGISWHMSDRELKDSKHMLHSIHRPVNCIDFLR